MLDLLVLRGPGEPRRNACILRDVRGPVRAAGAGACTTRERGRLGIMSHHNRLSARRERVRRALPALWVSRMIVVITDPGSAREALADCDTDADIECTVDGRSCTVHLSGDGFDLELEADWLDEDDDNLYVLTHAAVCAALRRLAGERRSPPTPGAATHDPAVAATAPEPRITPPWLPPEYATHEIAGRTRADELLRDPELCWDWAPLADRCVAICRRQQAGSAVIGDKMSRWDKGLIIVALVPPGESWEVGRAYDRRRAKSGDGGFVRAAKDAKFIYDAPEAREKYWFGD